MIKPLWHTLLDRDMKKENLRIAAGLTTNMIADMGKNKGISMETLEKICNALKTENLPMPEYTVNSGDIMIKFTGPEDRIIRVSGGLSEKLSDKLSDKLSEKEQKTLELLIEDPGYTSPQIAEKLNVSRVSVTKYLKSLKEKGLIERIGSDRKGYWRITR